MQLRVVVYAEGLTELGSENAPLSRPGDVLLDEWLGPAHWLIRRCIADVSVFPSEAISFEEPLRHRGRRVRGSDLLHRMTLRNLVLWPDQRMCPDLAVVLVDGDGDRGRRERLLRFLHGLSPHPVRVVAVAVKEFESWLLGDPECVGQVTGAIEDLPQNQESLAPRQAKELLAHVIAGSAGERSVRSIRIDIARHSHLHTLKRSRSFERFLGDLAEQLGIHGTS